ncbi:hypothetical protein FQN52_003641 [Onygenales sp. PD_12]|nr:hypothetical protein FQN52_003641 [Onygenales sp. PD_12]
MRAIRNFISRDLFSSSLLSHSFCVRHLGGYFNSGSRRLHLAGRALSDSNHDLEVLNRFTSGRWLWRERQQLACRYVKFDMSKLLELAASLIGSKHCVQAVKISEGQYNKVFLLTMNDGREVIAKLPNPNAGRPHFATASEVATMDFLRNVLNLPVPKVHAWSSRASENPVGAEYIIMEKQAGVVLSDVWESMKGKQKAQIVLQAVDVEKTLASTKFTKLGALYYQNDLPAMLDNTSPLYVDRDGKEVHGAKFGIGPTNHRSFFDFGRGELDIDHGPWSTPTEFMVAIANREILCARAGLRYPLIPEGLFSGPRQLTCPLQFSAAEVQQQEQDEELWAQGVELMNDFISDTGCFKHWDGKVSDADYELSKRQLAEGIERFLDREARNEEEREMWLKALPFVDHEETG